MELASVRAVVTAAPPARRATAARLAAAGGRVAFSTVPHQRARTSPNRSADAVFTPADVTSAETSRAPSRRPKDRLGGVTVLVNCAGIGTAMKTLGKAGPAKLEEFTRVVSVNLIGTFNCIRLAAGHMAQNAPGPDGERGVVINTASVAAFDGQIGQAAYSASKGGIVGMTLPMARDLAELAFRWSPSRPGSSTPALGTLPEPVRASLAKQVPFRRASASPTSTPARPVTSSAT